MNNSKTQRTPDEEMLEELERALPWAQDNMPPSIVRWMLEALLQGTPDVQRPDDLRGPDRERWSTTALYYLLSENDYGGLASEEAVVPMKYRWLRLYRGSMLAEEIRNYKQYEKKKTDE